MVREPYPTELVWFPTTADVLALSGPDALDFLHRMSTADIAGIPVGEGQATVFVTEKGRIQDVALLFHREVGGIELFCSPGAGEELFSWLRRFRFLEAVHLHPPQRWWGLELHGRRADELLWRLQLSRPTASHWGAGYASHWQGAPLRCFCIRAPVGQAAAYALFTPDAQLLEQAVRGIASEPLSASEQEALRILTRRGCRGREWTTDYNPWEAGLGELVSLTKGCYIGQEVLARLSTYERVQRRLLRFSSPEPLQAPAPLFVGEQYVGTLTSATFAPWYQRWVALGYVRREWIGTPEFQTESAPGERVCVYQWEQPGEDQG